MTPYATPPNGAIYRNYLSFFIKGKQMKRNIQLNGRRFVCRNVSHQFVYDETGAFSGVIQTSVVLEPEAIGPDGIQGNYPTSYPTSIVLPTPNWNPSNAPSSPADFLLAFSNGGVNNQWLVAGRYLNGTISVSASPEQFCANTGPNRAFLCGLNSQKGIVFYRNDGASETRARTVTVDSSLVVTLGAEQSIDATLVPSDIVSVSETKVLMALSDTGAGQDYLLAADVSGDTISPDGSGPVVLESTSTYTRLARLSESLAVAAYILPGSPDTLRAIPISISGTSLTLQTADTLATYSGISTLNVCALDNSTGVVFYTPGGADDLRAQAIYNISSSVNNGDDIELVGSGAFPNEAGSMFVSTLLSTEIAYLFIGASSSIQSSLVTYAGSGSISDGSDVQVVDKTNGCIFPCVAAIATNRVIAAYLFLNDGGTAYELACRSMRLDGDLVNEANEVIVDDDIGFASLNYPAICQLRTPN